jgi:sugar phosphate isomerase/epimerase
MQQKLFKTLWGFDGDYLKAIDEALADGFDGIEGPAPADAAVRREFASALRRNQLLYIQEICTGGDYVPQRHATPQQHLNDLQESLARGAELEPLQITSMAGCDAWSEPQSVQFFADAMALAEGHAPLSFETHRSRSLFNPWSAQRIIAELPQMLLTADFSHWCVVCERLMDSELDVIEAIAMNIHHVHARVGYEQGPQVPHPAAPEYGYALSAHQRWWELIWRAQRGRGVTMTTMTPEFGPDGYLHLLPFTAMPVGDLREINRWMANTEREHFNHYLAGEGSRTVAID